MTPNEIRLDQQAKMRRGELLGHIDPAWARRRYIDESVLIAELAKEMGCGVSYARLYLQAHEIHRDAGHRVRAGLAHSWNEGLTKDTDGRLKRLSDAHAGSGNPMAGRQAWNAGLTASDHPSVKRISQSRIGVSPSHTTRRKMAAAKRGRIADRANAWKGGFYRPGLSGYAHRKSNGRLIYEHREVAEQALGRPLLSDEEVHHKDECRKNNSPDNLIVILGSDHTKLHRAMRKVRLLDQVGWLKENGIWFVEVHLAKNS